MGEEAKPPEVSAPMFNRESRRRFLADDISINSAISVTLLQSHSIINQFRVRVFMFKLN